MMNPHTLIIELYLGYLHDQVGPPLGGPPPKLVKMKNCGAQQDDEECPSDQEDNNK